MINVYQGHLENFLYWAEKTPKNIYLRQPKGLFYKDYSYEHASDEVKKMGSFLRKNFIDDKKHVGIISKNCAHWILSDLAIAYAGGISVPFYPTLSGDQFKEVFEHSDCKILFVGKLDNWDQIKKAIPADTLVIHMSDQPNESKNTWEQIIAKEKKIVEPYHFQQEEVISIIYTSGTTGTPKGVMITSEAVLVALEAARKIAFLDEPNNRFISYLPLCHVAERNFVEFAGTACGGTIYFVESLDTFAANLKSASPTHFLAVPRIWLKFQEGILGKFGGIKTFERLKNIPLLGKILVRVIVNKLGLGKAKLLITGAAPISPELVLWYQGLGLYIQEAYGMTENLGINTVMPRESIKLGTVGKIWPICEVRIQEGEIQMRSRSVMKGYYKEPKLTKQAFEEDWLRTGDAGVVDKDGYLKITGRIKESFKTSKGFYVSPSTIETIIQNHPLVDQVCVVGSNLPEPMAMLVLKPETAEMDKEQIEEQLEELFDTLKPHVKHYELIKKIIVLQTPWTVENSCMTPTLKIRRTEIERIHEHYFADWFKSKQKILYY